MRLLPFTAAVADAGLTLKRQLTFSMPSRGKAVYRGHWRRSEDVGGHIRSV